MKHYDISKYTDIYINKYTVYIQSLSVSSALAGRNSSDRIWIHAWMCKNLRNWARPLEVC